MYQTYHVYIHLLIHKKLDSNVIRKVLRSVALQLHGRYLTVERGGNGQHPVKVLPLQRSPEILV